MSVRRAIDRVITWKATPYLILILISLALLLPIYWTVITSFKPLNEVFRWPPTLWPSEFTLTHYVEALVNAPVFWNILNSTKSVARHKTETVKKGGEGKSLEQGKREFQNLEFWQRKEKKA